MSKITYPSHCYDDNFVLRISPLLWLIIIWSVNHVLVLGLAVFALSAEVLALAINYAADPLILLSDLPGAVVLVAAINRRPAAGKAVRWVWCNGRLFLIIGMCAQGAAITTVYWKVILFNMNESLLIVLTANISFLALLLGARLIKDIFMEFPHAVTEK